MILIAVQKKQRSTSLLGKNEEPEPRAGMLTLVRYPN